MSINDDRLQAMDVLRGFALLGILIVNIQSFAMPGAAYLNPTAFGDLNGVNLWVWAIIHIFADQKFMSLFSMLFGAGVILFCEKAQQKGQSAAKLHYKRSAWLLLFGLIHAYLFWYGDILVAYSLCAFFIYLLRNKSIFTLVTLALILATISCAYSLLMGVSLAHFPTDAQSGLMQAWEPDAAALNKELSAYKGDFLSALSYRAEETLFMQTYVFLTYFFWRASAMMLLGMALFKSGFFHLKWQDKSYIVLAICGLLLGLPLVSFGVYSNFEQGFALEYSMFIGNQFNYWGSIFVALAYAAIFVLVVKKGMLSALQLRLAAIGKTAFSNYILHTLVFTTLFYGYGFELFAEIERWQQFMLVLFMWALQLWLAPLWLQHYKQGPLEWLWRTLTYGKKSAFRN